MSYIISLVLLISLLGSAVVNAKVLEFQVLEVRNMETNFQSEIMAFTKKALKDTIDNKKLSELTTEFMHQEYVPSLGEHAFCGVDLPEEFYSTIEYDRAYKMIRFHDSQTNLVISCWIYKHLLF